MREMEYKRKVDKKRIYIIASIIIVNYLMITLSYMNFSLVIDVIQDILHKDATLTGRSEIFTYSLAIFLQHPIWGYGFDNNIVEATLTKIVAAYNTAHNSILQMLINCGIIGTAFFLLSNYIAFSYINKSHNNALSVMYYERRFQLLLLAITCLGIGVSM